MAENLEQIVGFGTGSTSYDLFLEREGIPLVRDLWVKNVFELPLAPWKRKGGRGTYINLHGSGINTSYIAIDCFLVEIPAGGCLNIEHYMYEEILFVLKGRGATDIWTPKSEKQTFEWQEGSLFTIPLNSSHQLFNGDGRQPALILGCSFAPTMINLMHSDEFIFDNDFVFKDRYAGQADYFRGEGKVLGKKMLETNFIADVRAFEKLDNDPSRGYGRNVQLEMGCNSMSLHMSEFPVGTYKKAHRHEPGAHILILSGQGFTLEWPQGQEPVKLDWQAGSLFMPPDQWFHQQFNTGHVPARYLAFKPRGKKFRTKGKFMNNVSLKDGGNQIEFEDEDSKIRALFEEECARNGVHANMGKR